MYEHELETDDRCNSCKKTWEDANSFFKFEGEIFCEECFERETKLCIRCDERFFTEQIVGDMCEECKIKEMSAKEFLEVILLDMQLDISRQHSKLDEIKSQADLNHRICMIEALLFHATNKIKVLKKKVG